MSTVYLINNDGEVTEHSYSLPPIQAIKCAVLQLVKKNFNTWDYDKIDVPIKETVHSYIYPFSDNSAVWVRK